MHLPLWTRSPYAARHKGPALVERSDPTAICLPIQLQTVVPSCAVQCLETFIANNYNVLTCTSTADITFLCTNPTYSGLTIGEGSLQCLISSCIGADIQTQSGYTVCDNIEGAIPNMAGTITATVSAITTLFSSSESSLPITTNAPAVPTTSDILSSILSSEVPVTSLTSSAAPSVTPFPLPLTSSNPPSETETIPTSLSNARSSETSTASSGQHSSSVSGRSSSSLTTSSRTTTTTSVSNSSASRSATSSATAAPATEGAIESGLSASAIAGISTAAVIVAALIFGYLAYWSCIRRKEKKGRSKHLTTNFTPRMSNNPTGSAPVSVAGNAQSGLFRNPTRRFYSPDATQRDSWRRNTVPPNNIGIAVAPSTRVSPERRVNTQIPDASHIPWPAPYLAMRVDRSGPAMGESRWSLATSFDEDIEGQAQAQNQDLPALASPRTRASSRSFSSVIIEKPPPLQLTKTNQRPEPPARGMITLTPVYDNGTFEPTIRQVVEENGQPAGIVRMSRDRQAPNFSRREPSLTRTSQEDARPVAFQARQPNKLGRFPVKPTVPPRKQSETTDRTASVYTEIDEDSTPEDEDDKQLKAPVPAPALRQPPFPVRVPLRNIQYPQIPRPSAMSKQAEKPHSPRAFTIRRVDPMLDPSPPQQSFAARAQIAATREDSMQPNVSSDSSLVSQGNNSPIFPTPPPRNPARLTRVQPRSDLREQNSDTHRALSRPVTATTFATVSSRRDSEFPPSAYPGAPRFGGGYESPSLQRLSAGNRGRPLAQRLQAQGYMPRPPLQRERPMMDVNPIMNPPSRSKKRPLDPRSGDLYFTMGDM